MGWGWGWVEGVGGRSGWEGVGRLLEECGRDGVGRVLAECGVPIVGITLNPNRAEAGCLSSRDRCNGCPFGGVRGR